MDLAFIVQNPLKASDILLVKKFIKDIVVGLRYGTTLTWIGLITFNKDAEIQLKFGGNNCKLQKIVYNHFLEVNQTQIVHVRQIILRLFQRVPCKRCAIDAPCKHCL